MCTIDLSFNRLESLVLNGIRSYKLVLLLFGLTSLPRLFSMAINLDDDLHDLNDIYQLIFRLPSLKYNRLSLLAYEESILLPIAKHDQFSTIEYLDINHSCTLKELITMLSYTPRLRHLTCDRLIESDQNIEREELITLPKLTHFLTYRCNLLFEEFEVFIRKISSKLQVLRVTTSWVETYLEADRWEQLILQHMPRLRRFDFEYSETVDSNFDSNPYHAQINRFTSPFWAERRWRFELETDNEKIFYSIHSNRKAWYEFHDNPENNTGPIQDIKQETADSSIQFCQPTQLTLTDAFSAKLNQLFIDKIRPIVVGVQFTDLHIYCSYTSIGVLIELIDLLPNLDSLVLSSLLLLQRTYLSIRDRKMVRLMSNKIKITKVKFRWKNQDQETELTQIHFLIDLCPHVRYIEVGFQDGVDPNFLVRFILIKHAGYIPHLCSLCIQTIQANDEMVQSLQTMIDLEQLLDEYTIKRVADRIYLRWN